MAQKTKDTDKSRAAKAAAAKAAATARKRALSRIQPYGFLEFIREQGVVGVAIGLVFAAQVKVVVDQFLISFVNPILGLILPGIGDLTQKKVTLTISELQNKTAVFAWGQFAYVLMSFLITALIIYYVFKSLRLEKLKKQS